MFETTNQILYIYLYTNIYIYETPLKKKQTFDEFRQQNPWQLQQIPPMVTSLRHSRPSQTSNLADGMYSCGDAQEMGGFSRRVIPQIMARYG